MLNASKAPSPETLKLPYKEDPIWNSGEDVVGYPLRRSSSNVSEKGELCPVDDDEGLMNLSMLPEVTNIDQSKNMTLWENDAGDSNEFNFLVREGVQKKNK